MGGISGRIRKKSPSKHGQFPDGILKKQKLVGYLRKLGFGEVIA
jgi:hypothetical protein